MEFYFFDGMEYVECSKELKDDLLLLCEDNEIMKEVITEYFNRKNKE